MTQVYNDDEVDLREYFKVIRKRWKMIACLTIGLAVLALIFSLRQKPVYEAKTTILLRSGGSSSALSQYAGLAGMFGMNLNSGGGNIPDLMELLQSRVVAAKVLDDLKLIQRIEGWDKPTVKRSKLISAVRGMIKKPKFAANIVEVNAATNDPQLSADVANGFIDALSYYWNELNYTEAQKKLKYIESELPRVERELKIVEAKLKLSPSLASGILSGGQGGFQRDYEIYNSVFTMLKKEKESAKLEAAKEISPFSVVDRAERPLSKSKPRVKFNVTLGFVLGIFSGVFLAFFMEYWEKGGNK